MPEWTRALRDSPPLIAYHDTWPYLARRFRLRFVGIIEERPGVPPSASHLAKLAREGMRARVGAVVREPHEPARDAQFLAERMGARVAVLASSVGAVPEARDYISLIDYNVRALAPAR
jgi:ABC-type Zn uptake system ZnuABC Zn-binding protein ZnuA